MQNQIADARAVRSVPLETPPARAAETICLSKTLRDRLETLSAEANASLFTVLLAGFRILLMRHGGQDDPEVGNVDPDLRPRPRRIPRP